MLPTLLLPGLLCDATAWRHQLTHLHPLSDMIVPDLGHADTPEKMVAAVLAVAPPMFALAGHSMGGWVALEIMRVVPQRVSKLLLANTTARQDTPEKATGRKSMIAEAERGNMQAVIDKLLSAFIYQQTCAAQVKQMLEDNAGAFINQERAMLERDDCVPLLSNITCPTMVIHSTKDAVFSVVNSEELAADIQHASMHVIEDAGHMSLMEQPEAFTLLMKSWLESSC